MSDCTECQEYGCDYFIDSYGRLVSFCSECPSNPGNDEEEQEAYDFD